MAALHLHKQNWVVAVVFFWRLSPAHLRPFPSSRHRSCGWQMSALSPEHFAFLFSLVSSTYSSSIICRIVIAHVAQICPLFCYQRSIKQLFASVHLRPFRLTGPLWGLRRQTELWELQLALFPATAANSASLSWAWPSPRYPRPFSRLSPEATWHRSVPSRAVRLRSRDAGDINDPGGC